MATTRIALIQMKMSSDRQKNMNSAIRKITDAYKYASKVMIENMMETDSEEGIKAFIDKRKPNWN